MSGMGTARTRPATALAGTWRLESEHKRAKPYPLSNTLLMLLDTSIICPSYYSIRIMPAFRLLRKNMIMFVFVASFLPPLPVGVWHVSSSSPAGQFGTPSHRYRFRMVILSYVAPPHWKSALVRLINTKQTPDVNQPKKKNPERCLLYMDAQLQ